MAYKNTLGISVSQFKTRLRENPIGAFAFYGQEELLKSFYLQKLVTLVEKEGFGEFNISRLDLSRDHSFSDVLGEAEILPFCGEKRLVICRGLSPAKLSASETKDLLSLLEKFPPYLILVIFTTWEEFGEEKGALSKESVKKLAQKLEFVSFPLQDEKTLLAWSKKILASDSLSASDRALRLLFRLSGSKMNLIRGELEKLSAYLIAQKRTELSEEDVLLFAADTTELSVFNLCDAVLEGAVQAVENIYSNLKKQDIHPLLILSVLSKTLTGAILVAEGASAADCKKAAKVSPWQYEKYREITYGKKKEDLEKALFLCLELDQKLKSYHSDPEIVMEITLLEIARLLGGAK
jgi:DNA polymerase III delta subunit